MSNSLDSFYEDKFDNQSQTTINQVLCIIEGGDELSFIKKVYEIYTSEIECEDFLRNKIKLSYGMQNIEWQGNTVELKVKNREKCNFQGGDYQSKAPLPILESLYNEDLALYKAIIVMFDKDRDSNNLVENKAREKLEDINSKILFLSFPCFEKESMIFFMNDKVKNYINDKYQIIDNSTCRWYKQNYAKCLQFNPISNARRLDTLIKKLEKIHLEQSNINLEMRKLIDFIKIVI